MLINFKYNSNLLYILLLVSLVSILLFFVIFKIKLNSLMSRLSVMGWLLDVIIRGIKGSKGLCVFVKLVDGFRKLEIRIMNKIVVMSNLKCMFLIINLGDSFSGVVNVFIMVVIIMIFFMVVVMFGIKFFYLMW